MTSSNRRGLGPNCHFGAGHSTAMTPPPTAATRSSSTQPAHAGKTCPRFGSVLSSPTVAATDVPNVDSERVMRRLGMRFLERRVRDGLDTVIYELAREDFAPGSDVYELETAP